MALQTDFVPTPTTLAASITAPPTIQFTPPPECYDPANNWIVTTSCYLDLGSSISYPDWLTCSLSHFGAPAWYDLSCNVPQPTDYHEAPKVTQDGVVSYYAGCPVGFSATVTSSYPGWNTYSYEDHYDATAYVVACCPTQYHFELDTATIDPRQRTTTSHDGVNYSVFIYPLPWCAATSISELSGEDLAVKTWSNPMAWDKRQLQTIAWDYEHGTMFAHSVGYTYTVFQSTHTCYEYCDEWFTYYYPDGVGGTPGPAWPTTSDAGAAISPRVTSAPELTLTSGQTLELTSELSLDTSFSAPYRPTNGSNPSETLSQSVPGGETITSADEPLSSSTPGSGAESTASSTGDIPVSSPSSTTPTAATPSSTITESSTSTPAAAGSLSPSLVGTIILGVAIVVLS
ncbi:hypothetical protein GQX73_g410 [Xylaria multiplex]|uniref:Uncharacterized protein n=1 Tax=Xylaria multiplex TaxID=323545 RepID=A0A7C8J3R2_9PEZI|nr:hypothetical protein GQX73_g410 [Xylaria multiplex]